MSKKLTPYERARRALIRSGYAEDELDALYKKEEELLAFYAELKATTKAAKDGKLESPDDTGEDEEPEDDYKLSKSETAALDQQQKLELEAQKNEKTEVARATFEQATEPPKHLESGEAPPSYDDFMKSLQEGMTADDKDVPNN